MTTIYGSHACLLYMEVKQTNSSCISVEHTIEKGGRVTDHFNIPLENTFYK